MCRRHACNVDVVLASNLGLGDDQLAGVGVVGTSQGVLQDTDGPQNVANHLSLVGEVARVRQDHGGLGLELHLGLDTSHGGLDARELATLVLDLVDVGVQHVSTAVDGRQTGEALGQLSESVERVDVRGLSVASDRVTVEADTVDGLGGLAGGINVTVVEIKSHGVADEVTGTGLEAELFVDLLHGAVGHVQTWFVG